jgi:hypothetical protein
MELQEKNALKNNRAANFFIWSLLSRKFCSAAQNGAIFFEKHERISRRSAAAGFYSVKSIIIALRRQSDPEGH